ncbi:hypothetical protein OIV19_17495 [Brucella sp. HL-2]|nr:hypothetical protein [Brucella sp. HL-2]MCV9909395.1 hypothetical protein [Brucella sp. HL-2]
MIIDPYPPRHTRYSLQAIITRQMADVLLENNVDLAVLDACRHELERANFGKLAIDALIEGATQLAVKDFVANWQPTKARN